MSWCTVWEVDALCHWNADRCSSTDGGRRLLHCGTATPWYGPCRWSACSQYSEVDRIQTAAARPVEPHSTCRSGPSDIDEVRPRCDQFWQSTTLSVRRRLWIRTSWGKSHVQHDVHYVLEMIVQSHSRSSIRCQTKAQIRFPKTHACNCDPIQISDSVHNVAY